MHLQKLRSAGVPACVHHAGCAGAALRAGPLGRHRDSVVGLARHPQRAGLPGLSHQHVAKRHHAASGFWPAGVRLHQPGSGGSVSLLLREGSGGDNTLWLSGSPNFVTRVTATGSTATFTETAPSTLQLLYFVRAGDANGNLSAPSNLVGGPSLAAQ